MQHLIPPNSNIAVTGHRPEKLGGYTQAAAANLRLFAIQEIQRLDPNCVYSGMAQGWDQAVAEACIRLDIPCIACVPCDGQEKPWPKQAQQLYHQLLQKMHRVEVISPGPYAWWKMGRRDQYMVDHTSHLAALWNGTSGGTAKTVLYANQVSKPVEMLWVRWERFSLDHKRTLTTKELSSGKF